MLFEALLCKGFLFLKLIIYFILFFLQQGVSSALLDSPSHRGVSSTNQSEAWRARGGPPLTARCQGAGVGRLAGQPVTAGGHAVRVGDLFRRGSEPSPH